LPAIRDVSGAFRAQVVENQAAAAWQPDVLVGEHLGDVVGARLAARQHQSPRQRLDPQPPDQRRREHHAGVQTTRSSSKLDLQPV
jgi:hypothetical protein